MNKYDKGIKLLEESCGNEKDNIISLATMAIDLSDDNKAYPNVREVDAYYENGVFYITTWGKSNKMLQIANNKNVGFAVSMEGISGSGIGQNLGWVLDPKNAQLRTKLRKVFSKWYDHANNEKDENCIILAIEITRVNIFRDEGAIQYNLDLVNQKEII